MKTGCLNIELISSELLKKVSGGAPNFQNPFPQAVINGNASGNSAGVYRYDVNVAVAPIQNPNINLALGVGGDNNQPINNAYFSLQVTL